MNRRCGVSSQPENAKGKNVRERADRVGAVPVSNLRKVLGGAEGNRTPDLLIANEALYHLSYGPKERRKYGPKARTSSGVITAPCQQPPGAARS